MLYWPVNMHQSVDPYPPRPPVRTRIFFLGTNNPSMGNWSIWHYKVKNVDMGNPPFWKLEYWRSNTQMFTLLLSHYTVIRGLTPQCHLYLLQARLGVMNESRVWPRCVIINSRAWLKQCKWKRSLTPLCSRGTILYRAWLRGMEYRRIWPFKPNLNMIIPRNWNNVRKFKNRVTLSI